MVLHESGEDYLEAILVTAPGEGHRPLHRRSPIPGLFQALCQPRRVHSENQRLHHHGKGRPSGTDGGGEANAQRVYERHRFLTQWLIHLGVSPERPPRMPAALSTTSAPRPLSALSGTSVKTLRNKIRLTGARSGLSRRAPFNTHPKEEYPCPLTPFCPR